MSEYEVHAIRYGSVDWRRRRDNFLGGDAHDAPMPLDFFVWAVIGKDRSFVVDTGFDEATAQRRNRAISRPVAEGLRCVGVEPSTVGDVILTHMHFDHAGNAGLFPAARYHVQEVEMRYCTGRCMCHPFLRHAFEAEDAVAMVRRVYEGRVAFHDGASEIAPGITVHLVGGHSMGLQVVRVRTRRGWVVLASDASHFYENMEQGRPFPIAYNVADTLDGYGMLRRLADTPAHIVPGHDPLVLNRYPATKPGLAGVARLDADPLTGAA